MKKNKEQIENANTSVADSITTNDKGQKVVNGAVQISVSDSKSGLKRLGRPVVADSERQKKLKLQEERRAIYGDYVPLGRPVAPDSKRQAQLAEREAEKALGIVHQKGRPKMTEEDKIEAREKREIAKQAWLARVAAANAGVQMTGKVDVE